MQCIYIKPKICFLYTCLFILGELFATQAFSQSNTNSKKFVSINQTDSLATNTDNIKELANNTNNFFVPKPTIASQKANIAGYSNQSYKRTTNNSKINMAVNNQSIPEDELKAIVEANKPTYNQVQYQNPQEIQQNSYQSDAVIPFIVDSLQYKPRSQAELAPRRNNMPTNSSGFQNISYSNNSYNSTVLNNTSREDWNNSGVISNSTNNSATNIYTNISTSTSKLLNNAKQLLGIPYKYGGNTPVDGLDCSGFVRYVFYYTLGIVLPRRSEEIGQVGTYIEPSLLRAGDLVFFNTRGARLSHLGIYMGNGQFIHSPSTGSNIRIDKLANKYWAARYNGAKRIASLE